MGGVPLEEIVLHRIVEAVARLDEIVIIPAFYELIPGRARKSESVLDFSLGSYMRQHNYEFSKICPTFYDFSQPYSRFEAMIQCDAIWVRAKIQNIFNFSTPSAHGWRYELLNIPFLAMIPGQSNQSFALHPFVCTEENLQAGLEFYEISSDDECSAIANIFWKLMLTCQDLSEFIDVVLGDSYDDYGSVVMGQDFTAGYWNGQFHLY